MDFDVNKRVIDEVAVVQTKVRARNESIAEAGTSSPDAARASRWHSRVSCLVYLIALLERDFAFE